MCYKLEVLTYIFSENPAEPEEGYTLYYCPQTVQCNLTQIKLLLFRLQHLLPHTYTKKRVDCTNVHWKTLFIIPLSCPPIRALPLQPAKPHPNLLHHPLKSTPGAKTALGLSK